MNLRPLNLLLADDDNDDRIFFGLALEAITFHTQLTAFADGEKLMNYLAENAHQLPDVLFLDLNMPRKNGFECLSEIKSSNKLKHLPVIIYSTSFEQEVVGQLYISGAHFFMRKPAEFSQLKKIIENIIALLVQDLIVQKTHDGFNYSQPAMENFVLTL